MAESSGFEYADAYLKGLRGHPAEIQRFDRDTWPWVVVIDGTALAYNNTLDEALDWISLRGFRLHTLEDLGGEL